MDAMRKQLDALMGTNRNGSGPSIKKHFTDPDVCISYLLGLCPHEMFNNTKMDMGDCPKLHSAILKGEYEEARKKKDYGFDYHVEMQLQRYVEDCDRKIKRNIKHLEDIQAPDPEDKAIIQQVQEFMDLAEKLGEEGKVEESLEYIQKAEALKAKKSDMTAAAASIIAMIPSVPDGGPTASQHQKLRDARLKQREDRLQYINQSNDRTSYHDRNSYQVGDIDDSFERDLERIRQRQREQQRRDQEDDLPDRDKDRERVTNRDRDDYDEPRNGRRPAPYRRERIDYDRPQDDYDYGRNNNSRYDRQDYDRPRGREYRDYDRPTYNRPEKRYRDYDQPNPEPEYEQDYNDDSRDYRNYDDRDRDYNDRDYDRDRKGYDRDYDRNYDRDREYDKGRDYDDRDYNKDRDSDGEDRERERGYDNRPRNDADYRGRDYERSYDRDRDRDYDRDYDRPK